ncbi:MAG: penicillin-binding protein 1C [Campylobacter sp.]|nr:penicillin-binding protein 1C [Campylobacter sp.]
MIKKILKLFALFFIILIAIFIVADKIFPLNLQALQKDESKILRDTNNEIIRIKLSSDDMLRFRSQELPEVLKQSVILFEDRYFYYHFGINPFSIVRAFFHNLFHERNIGASTISMQVARMLDGGERTYKNKLKEIFVALQLEAHFSKDEILRFYFDLAPYGGNIQGVRAASLAYFGVEPSKLSYAQMALLSTIPKNPNKNRLDKISNINSLKNKVIKLLYKADIIDKSEFKRAQNEPFKNKRKKLPYNAPKYSDLAFANKQSKANLNLQMQKDILAILKNTMQNLRDKNANNAAALIIDNKKMSVISFVGSHDQNAKNGKNNALFMKRNVGSTLKPFIYSLALDSGLITPQKELIDTQISLNEYAPKNFSNFYLGIVSASDSLGFSLNIPAILLNIKLGKNSLYELLDKVNLVENSKEFYGESIVLGSAELSLVNLAHLYTIYAHGGVLKPLEFAGQNFRNFNDSKRLISEQSAYLTAKMLSEANRAYLGNAWRFAKNSPQIAFKTGTSYNSHDIYAIGVNANYTIAVWIGNFNHEKMYDLTGINDASKVIFDMFKLISMREDTKFIHEPQGILTKAVCLDAFRLKECRNFRLDEQISGVKLQDSCKNIRGEELEFLLKNKIISKDELNQSPCKTELISKKPLFFSPYDKAKFITNDKFSKVMVKCIAYFGDEIYYKIDGGEYIKVKSGSENIIELGIGEHSISCLDENSNLSEINIQIRR